MAKGKDGRKKQPLWVSLLAQSEMITPYDWQQAALRYANLPSLRDNFCHAGFRGVTLGPRRELVLILSPLIWVGSQGHYGPDVEVRFGGIVNFAEVETVFSKRYQERSELAYLRYDDDYHSKSGDLYVQLAFERVEVYITIDCSKLTVTEAEQCINRRHR